MITPSEMGEEPDDMRRMCPSGLLAMADGTDPMTAIIAAGVRVGSNPQKPLPFKRSFYPDNREDR